MIRYTTPIITLEVEGVDLTANRDVYVTIEQGSNKLTKSGTDLTVSYNSQTEISSIGFTLSQEESASFSWGKACQLQVNFISNAGARDATNIVTIDVMRNLLDEVLTYGD